MDDNSKYQWTYLRRVVLGAGIVWWVGIAGLAFTTLLGYFLGEDFSGIVILFAIIAILGRWWAFKERTQLLSQDEDLRR